MGEEKTLTSISKKEGGEPLTYFRRFERHGKGKRRRGPSTSSKERDRKEESRLLVLPFEQTRKEGKEGTFVPPTAIKGSGRKNGEDELSVGEEKNRHFLRGEG